MDEVDLAAKAVLDYLAERDDASKKLALSDLSLFERYPLPWRAMRCRPDCWCGVIVSANAVDEETEEDLQNCIVSSGAMSYDVAVLVIEVVNRHFNKSDSA